MLTQFRSTKMYDRISRTEWIHQFVKYAMVGAANVAVFLSLFNLLRLAGLAEVPAYVTAFIPTNVTSFLLNKRWAFRDEREHWVLLQYFRFAFFTVIALGLNTGAFALFLIPLGRYGRLGENIAALAPLPISVAWNFTAYRYLIFNTRRSSSPEGEQAASG